MIQAACDPSQNGLLAELPHRHKTCNRIII
jgi:hypothetical protein